jgi:hypothetical protein
VYTHKYDKNNPKNKAKKTEKKHLTSLLVILTACKKGSGRKEEKPFQTDRQTDTQTATYTNEQLKREGRQPANTASFFTI